MIIPLHEHHSSSTGEVEAKVLAPVLAEFFNG
jgi:hypothetical protein